MLSTFQKNYQLNNAESVRQFQPRVALWQPRETHLIFSKAQPRLVGVANNLLGPFFAPGFQANPGLALANAFSVTRFEGNFLKFPFYKH
jgi:hypothetical protein